jgi:hypothetical protein
MDNSWEPSSSTVLATSSNSTYYYGAVDSSNGYAFYDNGSHYAASRNVTLAQREVLWLKPDQIWVYDRTAQTLGTGFQVFNLDLETEPTITANQAKMTSTHGQLFFINSLLPGTSALATSKLSKPHNEANSPMNYLLVDTATPATSTRMLHTIEGKNSGRAASATNLVKSSAGTNFDGGVIGSTLVMFKRTLTDAFSSTTYPASGATRQYVTGLAPNRTYNISVMGVPASATTDSGGVLTFSATGAGNVTVAAASR